MKIEGDLGPDALRILRDVPGVAVEAAGAGAGGRKGEDARVRFGRASEPVALAVRRQANAATAWQLVRQAEAGPAANLLVVAAATTAEAREILERHGVALVDGLGNAHVDLPGLVLHTEGRRRRGDGRVAVQARLAGKAGVAAQALLLDPERDWKVQDLAGEAGVSIGLAHRVLARLEGEGLVAAEGAGPRRVRRVVAPTALLDLWAEENTDRGVRRARAYRLARDPRELASAVSEALEAAGIDHAVTGAAAAALVAPFVTSVPVTEVWVDSVVSLDDAVTAAGAEVVDGGANLTLAQGSGDEPLAFRRQDERMWIVNPFRLYSDLRRDPRRGREQAETLRQEVIGF
ncbi:MAG TPA: hypothetical protein VKH17_10855 [Acidimicrobiia bacterium]|nr:hypothetical protein [Acidimicrobiia bacterium]